MDLRNTCISLWNIGSRDVQETDVKNTITCVDHHQCVLCVLVIYRCVPLKLQFESREGKPQGQQTDFPCHSTLICYFCFRGEGWGGATQVGLKWSKNALQKMSLNFWTTVIPQPPGGRAKLQIFCKKFPLSFTHTHRKGLPLRESPTNDSVNIYTSAT